MKVLKKILYPHIAIVFILFPIAIAIMFYAMFAMGDSLITYCSYALAFYSLLILCLRIPDIVKIIKKIKNENKIIVKLRSDTQLRINIFLYCSLVWNIIYASFQLFLGFYNKSFWFFTMAGYYYILAMMRFYLGNHTIKYKPGENQLLEYKKYSFFGWMLLIMNLFVFIMLVFMISFNKVSKHHEIITISMAAYTFTTFTMAIVNYIKYRKYNSPVYSAIKTITLACACVSMISLTNTMLYTFGTDVGEEFNNIMLSVLGFCVLTFIIFISILIIIKSHKELKELKKIEN